MRNGWHQCAVSTAGPGGGANAGVGMVVAGVFHDVVVGETSTAHIASYFRGTVEVKQTHLW